MEGKGTIYIAGPMMGWDNLNAKAFNDAEHRLLQDGWNVVSPIAVGEAFGGPEWLGNKREALNAVMRFEREFIEHCDAIYLLRGWQDSVGALAELKVAIVYNLEIYLEPETTEDK